MEDLKGLQEDVYYFMILSFKELLYNSPTSHPLGNSQISNLVLKSQGHGESKSDCIKNDFKRQSKTS